MSTASKVFVVLLAVFSIAFVMLTVAHVAQEANWRNLATEYRTQAQVSEANFQAMLAASAAEKLALNDKLEEMLRSKQQVEAQRQEALAERDESIAALEEARHQNDANSAALTKLAGELQVLSSEATELRVQRNDLEKRGLELQRRNTDLVTRNRELTIQTTTMAEQIRQLQQVNYAMQSQSDLSGGGSAAPLLVGAATDAARPMGPPTSSPIRGSIKAVRGSLASLSVGSADRVNPGMRFVIYRNDKYLGDVTVTATEPNEAVGMLENTQGDIRVGDTVVDLAGLTRSR